VWPVLTRGDDSGGARLRTGDERRLRTGDERPRLGQWRQHGRLRTRAVGVAREAASGGGGVRTAALSAGAFMARALRVAATRRRRADERAQRGERDWQVGPSCRRFPN
jgi:hypothetical protein